MTSRETLRCAADSAKAAYLEAETAFARWLSDLAQRPYSAIQNNEGAMKPRARSLSGLKKAWEQAERRTRENI